MYKNMLICTYNVRFVNVTHSEPNIFNYKYYILCERVKILCL